MADRPGAGPGCAEQVFVLNTHIDLMRYNHPVRYGVVLTQEVAEWLRSCHPTKAERDKIIARLWFVFGLLREFGPPIGRPHVDRIADDDETRFVPFP